MPSSFVNVAVFFTCVKTNSLHTHEGIYRIFTFQGNDSEHKIRHEILYPKAKIMPATFWQRSLTWYLIPFQVVFNFLHNLILCDKAWCILSFRINDELKTVLFRRLADSTHLLNVLECRLFISFLLLHLKLLLF